MSLPGGVQITGFLSPTASGDTYATHDALYARDGLRNVDLLIDLDNIPDDRRRAGMIVGVGGYSGFAEHYTLQPEGTGWTYTITDWGLAFLTPSATTAAINSATFTGNTSGSCITDLYISNLYGCSPLTLHDGIQSTSGSVGNTRSIAWGNNVTVVGTNQPEISIIVISGITIGISDNWGVNAVQLTGEVDSLWNSYIFQSGGQLELTLYGGADPVETYIVDDASYDFSTYTDLFNLGAFESPTGTTHTTLSAIVTTQVFIDDNSYAFGEDLSIDSNYSMLVGSGMTTTSDYTYRFGKNITSSAGNNSIFAFAMGEEINLSSSRYSLTSGIWINNFGNYSHASGGGTESAPLANSGFGAFVHHFVNQSSKGNTSDFSAILGGINHRINNNADHSAIITGWENTINSNAKYSAIISGQDNIIDTAVERSVILGGQGITATTNDTVYVPKLNVGTLNGTAINVGLGLDINGMVVSGDTSATFTGNTSGDCITDIFVSNIHSCSPLNINPLDEGNIYVGASSGLTVEIGTGTTYLGINTNIPNYPLHVSGDAYINNGSVAIGSTSPDPTHLLRVSTDDNDGVNMTGIRVDMSHQAVQANGINNFSGIQVRSVPPKSNTGVTQQWGVNTNLTSTVSTGGTHYVIGGRFVAKSANADNYGIQIEDGTEVAGRVLVCQPTSLFGQVGLAHWEDITSLPGVSGDTFISGMTFNSGTYDLTIDRNDGASFTQSLSILATDMVVTGGTYDVNTGVVTFTNNSGGTFGVSGFTSGMTDSYTTTATTSGTEIQFTKNIGGGYTVDLDSMIATDISNTYFVTPTGNDTTGVRGNLHKPFKTITGARNKVVAELSASTISGDTLIHVYPGEYVEDEIQYENGNFYFEAGAVIKPPVRGGLTPVFNLGATLTLQPNTYTADTCNVYGNVIIELQSANSNGVGLFARGSSVSTFEFDKLYCGNGYGLALFDNSKVITRGNEVYSETNQYSVTTRGSAVTYIDIDKFYNTGSTFTVDWRGFNGTSYFKSSEMIGGNNTILLFTDTISDGGVVVSDVGVIHHQTTGSEYLIQNNLQSGGKITHNVGSILTSGVSGGAFSTQNSSGGECNINGDIKTESTAIYLNTTNSIGYSFFYDGNIQTTNPTTAINLDDGTVRLNGSLNGLGTTTNGVDVASTVDLTVNNFIIENVSGSSITGTGSVDILNSLYIDKDLSVSRTGQYIFTGTTYTERLNVGTLNGTAINVGLGLDINGMVVSGETGGSTNKYAASIPFTGGTKETITHNLNSTDVQVQLKDSTGTRIIEDIADTYTSNTVDIEVSITGTYRVIIIG